MFTLSPLRTFLKTSGSPSTLPMTLTGLAGLISSPRLAGVGPKKMQKAFPGGQYPRSPTSTTSLGFSAPILTGMEKYISSPHVFALASMGRASHMARTVIGLSSVSSAWTSPADGVTILILMGASGYLFGIAMISRTDIRFSGSGLEKSAGGEGLTTSAVSRRPLDPATATTLP